MSFEYKLFSWLVEKTKRNKIFQRLRKSLISTRSKTLYSVFLARIFLLTFLSFVIGIVLFFIPVKLPENIRILKYFFPIIFPLTTFLFLYFDVVQKEALYKSQIENNLIAVVSHMMSIAESNINPYSIFKIISQFDEYGALAKEFKEIVNRVEVYGMDFITAIKEVASTSSSIRFKKFLNNVASVIESGGDLKNYLKITYDYLVFDWRVKREEFLQKLGTINEIYVGLVVSSPLFLVSIIVVMAAIQANIGFISLIDLLKIFTYLLLPLLNIIFLVIIKGIEVEV